jgi:Icc-related predicted phosphoesterase
MRIVAVADTHLFHHELVVPDGDVFVHAGDMCRGGELSELEETARWIRSLPHARKIVVAGNHDWAFVNDSARARAALGPEVTYLEDSEATVNGVRFWGSPWQPEFNDWAYNLPRGAPIASKWALIPKGIDVLITHGPPMGIGDRGPLGERAGCADLLARVREIRPRLHLFGHIHQDGGVWHVDATCFANVTTWECERQPTVLTIEPGTVRAHGEVVPPARRVTPQST